MNIVSYSFFRHDASGYESANAGVARGIFFLNFIRCLVRAHHAVWDGWELRIHHDDRVREFPCFRDLQRMQEAGLLRLVDCGKAETLCGSMLWRMKPLFDEQADYVVCRDVDSLPMPRDKAMVIDWINSGADAHAILDSESHSGPFMGGMSAFDADTFVPNSECGDFSMLMKLAVVHGIDMNRHGADQLLLNRGIWPRLKGSTLIHQKRQDIGYPEAFDTRPVAPKIHPLDRLVHIGAAFDVEKALEILNGMDYPNRKAIEACEVRA